MILGIVRAGIVSLAVAATALGSCPANARHAVRGPEVASTHPLARSVVGLIVHRADQSASICSGVIIAVRKILTSRHCLSHDFQIARTSQMEVIFNVDLRLPNALRITGWVGSLSPTGDLATVVLASPIPVGYRPLIDYVAEVSPDYPAYIAGYGPDDCTHPETMGRLRMAEVPVDFLARVDHFGQWTEKNIIHKESANGLTCPGDSGAPVFGEYQGRYYLIGIHRGITGEGRLITVPLGVEQEQWYVDEVNSP